MTPAMYEKSHILCDTIEIAHTCTCGFYLEWSLAHRPGGFRNQVFQTCPVCGAKYRKYMADQDKQHWGDFKRSVEKRQRDRLERPITPYDEDGMTLGEALRRMREEDAAGLAK